MGEFQVTGHYEMPARGAFVLGELLQGKIAPGMVIETRCEPSTLKIVGVECMSDSANNRHSNALIFLEKPSMDFLLRVMPVGSIVEVVEGNAA